MHASPPAAPIARGVGETISSAEQVFQVLGPVMHGAGLRLAYIDHPSFAQDPHPPFEEKPRLMVCWAREMDHVVIDREWHEDTLRYLTGCNLKVVQKQIAADPRVTASHNTDTLVPPLPPHQLWFRHYAGAYVNPGLT
ncbi:hypothetical protein KEM55_003962 [Ascosphaera atra]|nr:hypothetical protein KEM55_003962 [Ascosphaera atra]